jgi:hypothetical protein
MTAANLIYPMFAMVVLTAVVLVVLFRSRVRAVREGKVKAGYFKIYQGQVEPEYAAKPARHFSNLFEVPTLFYTACLTAMITQQGGQAIQVLAWVYVVARVLHAYIHLGRNKLQPRIAVYFVGWLALLVMWICLVVGVATRA